MPAQAAPAPTTSPAAAVRYWKPLGGSWLCETNYACASVPYNGGEYIFKFYNYGSYYLSNWFGPYSPAINNQTGGAAMRLYNGSGVQVKCIPAPGLDYQSWDPIWRIDLTSTPC